MLFRSLNELKSIAGIYWDEILGRIGDKGVPVAKDAFVNQNDINEKLSEDIWISLKKQGVLFGKNSEINTGISIDQAQVDIWLDGQSAAVKKHVVEILKKAQNAVSPDVKWARATLKKMENAKKLPYSRGRLEHCLRGATRHDRKQEQAYVTGKKDVNLGLFTVSPTVSLETSPSEINACLDFFEELEIHKGTETVKIFDEDGVSQISAAIENYNTMDETKKQLAVSQFLKHNGLTEKLTQLGGSDDRANSIVDMVVTFLVFEVRECVVSQPADPPTG